MSRRQGAAGPSLVPKSWQYCEGCSRRKGEAARGGTRLECPTAIRGVMGSSARQASGLLLLLCTSSASLVLSYI